MLRFVKPSYELNVTGLHHELLDVRRNNAIQKRLRDAARLQVGFLRVTFPLSKFRPERDRCDKKKRRRRSNFSIFLRHPTFVTVLISLAMPALAERL